MRRSIFFHIFQSVNSLRKSGYAPKRAWFTVLPVVLFTGIAASQPIIEEIPDAPEPGRSSDRNPVVIVVQPVQQALYPPSAFVDRYKPEQPTLEGWADPSVWELIALRPGEEIPVKKPVEIGPGVTAFATLIGDFDYLAATSALLETVEEGAEWNARAMRELDFVDDKGKWHPERAGRRGFVSGHREYLVLVRLWYSMTPDLRRVRLIVQLRMYKQKYRGSWAVYPEEFRRTYEYLSPPLAPALWPWAPGQQQRLIRALDDVYEARLEAYPVNKTTYRREYKRGVRVLERRKTQLMPDFLLVTWPQDKLEAALATAAQSVGRMMQFDLRSLPPEFYRGHEREQFFAVSAKGKRKQYWGRFLFQDGENSVFQKDGGDYYSVPKVD